MKLSDWIKKNNLSYSQAANAFGIININPAVQPNDFYEEYWQREEV